MSASHFVSFVLTLDKFFSVKKEFLCIQEFFVAVAICRSD